MTHTALPLTDVSAATCGTVGAVMDRSAAEAGAALGLLLCAAALAGFGYLDALRVARSRAT